MEHTSSNSRAQRPLKGSDAAPIAILLILIVRLYQPHPRLALTIALAATALGGVLFLQPFRAQALLKRLDWLACAFAFIAARVALAIIFYGVFTPLALLFRLLRRDPLARGFHNESTYWSPRPQPTLQSYLCQS